MSPFRRRIKKDAHALHFELLIAEGSYDEAIALFESLRIYRTAGLGIVTLPTGQTMKSNLNQLETKLAQAYGAKGDMNKAIEVLEKLILFDPNEKIWRLTPPKIYYDLGRLYEKKGMMEKAREKYTKFLELWKNADPGLPEVGQR